MKTKDILIKQSVICIFDCNLPYVNLTEVSFGTEDAQGKYIYQQLVKYYDDITSKKARIEKDSFLSGILEAGDGRFQAFVESVAGEVHKLLKENPEILPGSGIFVWAVMEDQEYMVFLKVNHQSKFICTVGTDGLVEWKYNNKVLPETGRKIDQYCYLNVTDAWVRVSDFTCRAEGRTCNYLADLVLKLQTGRSEKEVVEAMDEVMVDTIQETYRENAPKKILEYKKAVADIVEEKGAIALEELRDNVFFDNEEAGNLYLERKEQESLPEEIVISRKMEKRLTKKQRIVTESGIEILVPMEYLQDNSVFEYIQDESGRVSIVIKDIGSAVKG